MDSLPATPTDPRRAALPVRDHDSLRAALTQGDVPTLLMVLMHFERDVALLARFAPFIGSIFEPPREIPQDLIGELRERLFAALTEAAPSIDTELPPDLMRLMLGTDVAEPVTEEFIPMLMEQMGFEPPERRSQRSGRHPPAPDFRVLVIGAGLTGILAAIKLAEAGYNFSVIEKNPQIGGTWFENIYPGVAVDTPSHFYSYSFELNPDWSHYAPEGPEFQQYLLGVVEKYNVRQNVIFNTRVTACEFDEQARVWRVRLTDAEGERVVIANAIINAQGPVNRWKMPDIPGLASFRGPKMHTAAWDPDIRLEGKRVAMIGTAASAAQLGTRIAPDVAHLTVFQRSRHWVMPNHHRAVPDAVRWAMRHIPHYAEWFRFRAYWFAADGLYANIQVDPEWTEEGSVSAYNKGVKEYCLQNYRSKLSHRPDLLEKLLPDYPVFGKRIVMDIDWLDTLARDNVTLEVDPIDHISPGAIVMRDGRSIEVDAILCATGFHIADMTGGLHITGRGGRVLRDEWGDDDPRAYMGVTIPGYPNFFLTVGPNSAPNHAGGQNITSEVQVHYILECLELLNADHAKTMEPTAEAFQRWNDDVDDKLKGLIWMHPKAKSYYRNSKDRVFLSSPYRLVEYWNMTRRPRTAHYHLSPPRMDPTIAALLANAPPWPPTRSQPVEQLRAVVRASAAAFPPLALPLASVEDRRIPGPAGEIPVRIYTPEGEGPFPLIVYFHGGGYVVGDLDSQDAIARALAHGAGAVLVSVDYRLAPENPFPAGADDCWAATRWAAAHASDLNGDASRLAVAGDSAGANFAAGVCIRARDEGGPRIMAQLLFYGSCDYPSEQTASSIEFADGPLLSADDVSWFWEQYLRDPIREQHNPIASPARAADHRGLPPVFMATAEIDPSRDHGEAFVGKLAAAGVVTQLKRYPGMIHGFVSWLGVLPAAQEAIDDACGFLATQRA